MNVDFPVALRPVIANFTFCFLYLYKLLSMYADTAIGPSFSANRRKMSMSFTASCAVKIICALFVNTILWLFLSHINYVVKWPKK